MSRTVYTIWATCSPSPWYSPSSAGWTLLAITGRLMQFLTIFISRLRSQYLTPHHLTPFFNIIIPMQIVVIMHHFFTTFTLLAPSWIYFIIFGGHNPHWSHSFFSKKDSTERRAALYLWYGNEEDEITLMFYSYNRRKIWIKSNKRPTHSKSQSNDPLSPSFSKSLITSTWKRLENLKRG